MRTSARPALAIAASVLALLATTSAAHAGVSDVQPNLVVNCSLGHEHQVYGGEAWARCGGDSGKYQVRADCRKPDGTLTLRSGLLLTVPTPNDSRVRCLPDEMPIDASINAEPFVSDPRPYPRPCVRFDLPVPVRTDDTFVESAEPSGRYQVGYSVNSDDERRLLLWENGELADITGDLTDPKPADVNASGQIIGSRRNPYRNEHFGWRYRNGVFIDLPGRGRYTQARPKVINGAGQIAGQIYGLELQTGWSDEIPAVWSADNKLTLLEMPAGFDYVAIEDIDEDGSVLGNLHKTEDDGQAPTPIVWHPDGTWRLLSDPHSRGDVIARSIRAGKVVGNEVLDDHNDWPLIYVWDATTGEATLSPILGRAAALNSRGALAGRLRGPVRMGFWGPDDLRARLLPVDDYIGNPTTVTSLTDNDVAYGYALRQNLRVYHPIKWDCSN